MDLQLQHTTAMVAGGSKGLGFAVAKLLAEEGANVSLASRNPENLSEAKRKIEAAARGAVLTVPADLTRSEEIMFWKEETVKSFGRVDFLLVNSGGPPAGSFASFTDEQWQEAIDLQLLSAVRLVRAVLPVMQKQKSGSILFSTSVSVKEPINNLILSNVIRPAVAALAKSLSLELVKDNIRVNHILPGRINTDRIRELDAFNAERKNISVEEQSRQMTAAIPMGRYGEPEEFARAAVFLLSPAASYITGASLQVDGGIIKSVL